MIIKTILQFIVSKQKDKINKNECFLWCFVRLKWTYMPYFLARCLNKNIKISITTTTIRTRWGTEGAFPLSPWDFELSVKFESKLKTFFNDITSNFGLLKFRLNSFISQPWSWSKKQISNDWIYILLIDWLTAYSWLRNWFF